MESLAIPIQVKAVSVPDEYVMAKMLRTSQASYAPFQCIDICTGELFAPTKDQCQVEANQV